MGNCVSGPIVTQKKTKTLIGKVFMYYKIWEEIVVDLRISGAKSFFLVFRVHQDTESE